MAGILDTFKQLRDDKQSLDTLASLPQTLIMNMVQRKEIPQEDLPMIMAKKAEMAQTNANIKAAQAQQQQGQAGTIMEQLMAANAAEEATRNQPAPRELTDVGIASNPVPEMRMAGGGIVAFAKGDLVEEDMTDEEYLRITDPEKYALQKRQSDAWKSLSSSKKPYLAEDFRRDAKSVIDPIKNFFTAPFDKAAADNAKKAEIAKLMKDKNLNATDAAGLLSIKNYMQGDDTAIPEAKIRKPSAANPNAQPPKTLNVKTDPAKPTIQEEQKSLFDEYKKLYAEDKEASKAARDEAKNMALLEAGLNMMGGESPYAFANIGKGAAAAAKGYAENVKGLRAEDRDRKKQLALLGIKEKEMGLEGRKLDITEQRYKEMSDLERQKINALAQRNTDDKMAQGVRDIFGQLMKKYDSMLSDGSVTEEDLYRRAQEMYKTTTGKDMKGGSAAPTNTGIGYNAFMGKK